jgi:hypothetical protein
MLFGVCGFVRGQKQIDTASIIEQILKEHADTGSIIFTDRIEPYFLRKTKEQVLRQQLTGYSETRSHYCKLTKADKSKLLQQFERSSKPYWQTNDILSQGKVIPYDSLKNVTSYIDSTTLQWYIDNDKLVKLTSFSAPMVFDNGNKFIIFYGNWWILPKWKLLKSVSHDIAIYKREGNVWTRWLTIEGGITCN